MPPRLEAPNRELGPYATGDTIPGWVLTITQLLDSSVWTSVELHVDNPDGTDFDLGSTSGAFAVATATTGTVTVSPDTTKTFAQHGTYVGNVTLKVGAERLTVQPFVFEVRESPFTT